MTTKIKSVHTPLNDAHANIRDAISQWRDSPSELAVIDLMKDADDLLDEAKKIQAELLAALEKAVEYLDNHRPKGKIRDIFSELNEHENAVLKPARAAIAKARKGKAVQL